MNGPLTLPPLRLNDGNSVPILGFGSGSAWSKGSDKTELNRACVDAIKSSIKLGYRHLDTSEIYNTEAEMGVALQESEMPREEMFITTKVFVNIKDIAAALKKSLENLQTDYVDLYLIHAPFFSKDKEDHQKKWKQMEKLKSQGLVKSIGVSNYLPENLDWILETATVYPAVNQIEFHPYLQRNGLLEYHRAKGIATCAYGPLSAVTKGAGGPAEEILSELATKYHVSVSEVCIRWCMDQNIAAITTSSKEERLKGYLRVMEFKLTTSEIEKINITGMKHHFRAFHTNQFDKNDRR